MKAKAQKMNLPSTKIIFGEPTVFFRSLACCVSFGIACSSWIVSVCSE